MTKEEKSPTTDGNVIDVVQSALDEHLSHLGELFYRVHVEGVENMFNEPKHLSDEFIKKNKLR